MTAADSKSELKVMTFNVKVGSSEDGLDHWRYRRSIFMELLWRYPHDLICTQEGLPFQLTAIKEEFGDFDYVGKGRYHGVEVDREQESGSGEHCAIFFDEGKFTLRDHGTFWLSDTPEISGSMSWGNDLARIVTWAYLEIRHTRKRFYTFNTHFHWGEEFQRKAALLLSDRIRSLAPREPVILAGDFNAVPWSEPWKILKGSGAKDGLILLDCWQALNMPESKGGSSHSFTGQPEDRIDWILASGHFRMKAVEIIEYNQAGRYPSDHFPVLATLELS